MINNNYHYNQQQQQPQNPQYRHHQENYHHHNSSNHHNQHHYHHHQQQQQQHYHNQPYRQHFQHPNQHYNNNSNNNHHHHHHQHHHQQQQQLQHHHHNQYQHHHNPQQHQHYQSHPHQQQQYQHPNLQSHSSQQPSQQHNRDHLQSQQTQQQQSTQQPLRHRQSLQQQQQFYKGYNPSTSNRHNLYNSAFNNKAIEERQDVVFRKVRGILNKITPETFDKLSNELVNVGLDSPRTLRGVIYLLFDKVLKDLKYSSLYAKLCQELSEKAPNFESDLNGPNTFCKFLISKCEDEFDRRRKATEDFDCKNEPLTDDEYELKAIAKQKMLGNIKFICELGKKRLLQKEILHECIRNLLSKKKEQPIQEQAQDLECLCQIMRTIGSLLDIHASKNLMNQYFERIDLFSRKQELPSRIRFMLKDIIDLRNNNWRPRTYQREDNVPQPLSKLREEAGTIIGNSSIIDKFGNSRSLIGISDLLKMNGNKLSMLLDDDGPSFTTTTDFHWGSSSFLPLDQFETQTSNKSTSSAATAPAPLATTTKTNPAQIRTTPELRQTQSLQSSPPKYKHNQFPHQQQQVISRNSFSIQSGNRNNINNNNNSNNNSNSNSSTNTNTNTNSNNDGTININNNNNYRGNMTLNIDKPTINRDSRRYIQRVSGGDNFSLRPSHNLVGNRNIGSNRSRFVGNLNDDTSCQTSNQKQQSLKEDNLHDVDVTPATRNETNKIGVTSENKTISSQTTTTTTPITTTSLPSEAPTEKIQTPNDDINRNAAREFHVNNFISVLLASTNISRTACKVKELKTPKNYQQDCLVSAIKQSILKSENDREHLAKLLDMLIPSTFESQSLLSAFKVIFEQMHALEVETPKVKSLVAGILAKAIHDNLITLEDLSAVLNGGKHHPLFLLFLQKLEQIAGQAWLNEKFISSKINLIEMLPEADRSKDRLASILKDRCLGFLDPMLTIEPELWSQMKEKDASPSGIYRWIKENVDQTIQATPTFGYILITCLLKYVSESKAEDFEKEMLTKYQQVLQAILKEKKMQLACLYALQSFYHGLDFPKGSLLRWFHMLYDMNIVDDDVFFIWKEEINDEYPGKGQALFQVNTWLNWLAEAESEEEDEM